MDGGFRSPAPGRPWRPLQEATAARRLLLGGRHRAVGPHRAAGAAAEEGRGRLRANARYPAPDRIAVSLT